MEIHPASEKLVPLYTFTTGEQMMTLRSFGLRFCFYLGLGLALGCGLYTTTASAQSNSNTAQLLSFFPEKPLGVFHLPSFRLILQDIENLATRVGYGAPAQMFREQGFRTAQGFFGLQTPITSWSQLLQATGLGSELSLAVAAFPMPTSPYVGAVVVVQVENSQLLTQLITQKIPAQRDASRWKHCQRYQQRLQQTLTRLLAGGTRKSYTLGDLNMYARVMKRRCGGGVQFKIDGDRVVSPDLEQGLEGFRKRWGTPVQVTPISKWATSYRVDKLSYTLVGDRYLVWASHPSLLQQALQLYRGQKTGKYLAQGFQQHLDAQARFHMYVHYPQYLDIMLKFDQIVQQYGGSAASQPFNLPQIKKLQQQTLALSKGYDGLWADAHVKKNRYAMSTIITVNEQRSPLVELFLQSKPTQIKSLAMLPQSTAAVFSMNLVLTFFNFANLMLKNMNDPSLSQVAFFINQWQSLIGEELTLAFASSPQRPIQGILMVEVRQGQQLLQLLMSLTAMLGSGEQSPLKTTTHQGTQITYLFRPRTKASGSGSPADRLPPGELAFALVDNFFVITYQMSNTPDLYVLKRMLDPKLRAQTSLLKNPTLLRILRRLQSTNALMYLSVPKITRLVQQIAPPMPQVVQALQVAKAFQYLFASFRNEPGKNIMSGISEMGMTPPSTQPSR